MSKSYTFNLGARDIRATVITHESALEEGLKLLLSTFNVEESEKNNVGQNFERVVGLDTEKSFSSTSDGLVSEKVALLKLCSENDCLEEGLKLLLSTFNVEESEKNNVGQNFERVVGLDTEKSFSSTSDGLVSEKVALLKLCSENDCLLVHLTHFKKIPTSLAKFLNLSDVTFVGMSIKHNLSDLQRDYGVQCRNVIELGPFAAAVQKKPILSAYSLPDLFKFVFKYPKWEKTFGKSTNVAFSDWGTSTLSLEQIWHASIEVHATIMIVNELIRYYS